MRVLVVVLNWNGVDDTMDCLDALSQQTHAHAMCSSSITGRQAMMLRGCVRARRAGTFLLHEEPENLGFAGGVNVGIRRGLREGYDAIALLNNDAVPEPEWLAALVAAIDREDASIATGLLLRESDDPALRGTIDTRAMN
ncbi:glycosyltransferase family 2 protein [Microbacterium amylolyticum]|uniref:glycosyltransferase family 2 protein n=1 Tax=Microbacterium amylolyticum TaxID=936337 RepID=UPI00361D9B66